MKANALKRRKEKFNPNNDTSMVEKIEERSKKEQEASEGIIAMETPLPAVTRTIFWICISWIAAKSMEELRERLNAKIEMLRKNRVEAAKKNDKQQKENSKKRASPSKPAEREKRVKTDKSSEKVSGKKEETGGAEETATSIAAPSVDDVISK